MLKIVKPYYSYYVPHISTIVPSFFPFFLGMGFPISTPHLHPPIKAAWWPVVKAIAWTVLVSSRCSRAPSGSSPRPCGTRSTPPGRSWRSSPTTLRRIGAPWMRTLALPSFSPPARWGLLDFMSVAAPPRPLLLFSSGVRGRTSTTTSHAQCSLPDLNHDQPRPVFAAGPQPRPSTPSVRCRTSIAGENAKRYAR